MKNLFLLANSAIMSVSYFSESRKPSRWDTSKQEKKEDSISEFLSLARSKVGPLKQESSPLVNKEEEHVKDSLSEKVFGPSSLCQASCGLYLSLVSRGQHTFSVKGQILRALWAIVSIATIQSCC